MQNWAWIRVDLCTLLTKVNVYKSFGIPSQSVWLFGLHLVLPSGSPGFKSNFCMDPSRPLASLELEGSVYPGLDILQSTHGFDSSGKWKQKRESIHPCNKQTAFLTGSGDSTMTSGLKVLGLIPAIAYWCFIKCRASKMCKIELESAYISAQSSPKSLYINPLAYSISSWIRW